MCGGAEGGVDSDNHDPFRRSKETFRHIHYTVDRGIQDSQFRA